VLASLLSATLHGLDGRIVRVEVDVAPGLPGFAIVGLADTALQEARERVRGAIRNSGYEYPPRRITVNLAPADLRKGGASLDLAIALGIMVGSEQVKATGRWAVLGELSLGGDLRPVPGLLPMVAALARRRVRRVIVPADGAAEASLADGVEVMPAATLAEAAMLVRANRHGRPRATPPRVELADSLGLETDGGVAREAAAGQASADGGGGMEAGRNSGALITAGWALEQGRECFLVPGPLDAPTSEGCHAFLRSFPGQTRVVCGIPELMEDLGLVPEGEQPGGSPGGHNGPPQGVTGGGPDNSPARRVTGAAQMRPGRPGPAAPGAGVEAVLAVLAPVERSVAELLTGGPATADDLAVQSGLTGAAILSALTLLELRGLVVGSYGRYMPAGALARWPGVRQVRHR
jgi:hypothetical protein